MRTPFASVLRVLAFAVPFVAAPSAFAGADPAACGNIQVSAESKCELVTSGGCSGACTPISCEGQCNASATVECSGSCQASCEASCSDPGSFDCEGHCNIDCSANCDGQCQASGNQASCKGACEASCKNDCAASCDIDPPDCQAACQGSCEGSCTAEANASCQIDCQGGCNLQCESPDGALLCDGSYVDTGNNLQDCLDYLGSLGIAVEGYAGAECANGRCTAEAGASASCSASPYGEAPVGEGVLAVALGSLALAVARRRKSH